MEFFTIFGGVEWGSVDTHSDIFESIKKLVLDDYTYIRNDISDTTTGMPLYHSILSGIAMGDGRTHSAFKKANVDSEVGMKAIDELCEMGVIKKEVSRKEFTNWAEDYKVSDKLLFDTPFMRFWFAFISPLFKGIKEGNYQEVEDRFLNHKAEFINLTFQLLSLELLKLKFKDDPIVESGSYWDKDIEIDLYAKTSSGKIIVGRCRYSNTKVKKSELTKLQDKAADANIKADIFVIIAKKGFSSELKSLKSENLKLFTLKDFKAL
ncbi:MAG: DUF234 domain-containing protein [Campylobacterota bacterium]|nr:DUF234 domain-containing protein [Campylobacterota bacterium]